MMIDLSGLNDNQKLAVAWQDGPLLVLAGPGSGKTRVLTYRIARLIHDSAGQRFKILGLTFTNKAAGEMRERVDQLVPDASARTLLTTFHSFCTDLLRQHGHHLGLQPNFTILSQEADRQAVLDEAIADQEAAQDYQGERLLPMVTRLLDQNVTPEQAQEILSLNKDAERLARIYTNYRARLIAGNRLDFGALIAEAIVLLESKPAIRKQIQRIYPYVCVDEFQDTNLAQYRVLRQLVNPDTKNLFVVADDDQIIYQWNGADPERLEQLRKEFSMTEIQLPESYRCPPEVIEIANKLIIHNLGRSADKKLLQARKPSVGKSPVRIRSFRTLEEEAAWVAKDIAARPASERAECAILARTRKVLDVFVQALDEAGVKGHLSVRKNEFTSAPMRWLHAMLRLANSRQDREQLRHVCKAFYTLEGINVNVRDIVSRAATEDGDYLRAWQSMVRSHAGLAKQTRNLIDRAMAGLVDQLAFGPFVKAAFEWFDAIEVTSPEASDQYYEYEEEKEVWEHLVNDIMAQYGREKVTLHLLLQELDLRSKTPTPPPGAIPCYTIHASKGLEFGHVYLVALVEDQLPSWAAIKKGDDSHEMQEERRNCFVAISRARDALTLTYPRELFGWAKKPSRFLREMKLLT